MTRVPATAVPLNAPRFNMPPVDPPKGATEPSTTSSPSTIKRGDDLDRDAFLKLLVAQMNNQDPLNPMDGQQMATQLAQFSSVEQLLKLNETIEAQGANDDKIIESLEALGEQQALSSESMLAAIESTMALGAVGKIGVLPGDRLFIDGSGRGVATFDAGASGATAGRLRILDSKGEPVAERALGNIGAGTQSLELSSIQPPLELPAGEYRFAVELQDNTGAFKPAKIFTSGRITGLTATASGPQLLIGDRLTIPFSRLLQVRS
jgi:flagellar basal-body rod modification protein FlgD